MEVLWRKTQIPGGVQISASVVQGKRVEWWLFHLYRHTKTEWKMIVDAQYTEGSNAGGNRLYDMNVSDAELELGVGYLITTARWRMDGR